MKRLWPALAIVALIALTLPHPVLAVNLNDLRIGFLPGTKSLFDVINSIINFVLLLGGAMAFFYAIFGGFQYLTSAGDPGKASAGTKTITNAIIGMLIIAASYALVAFVANYTRGGGIGGNARTTKTGSGVDVVPGTSTGSTGTGGTTQVQPVPEDNPTSEPPTLPGFDPSATCGGAVC